MKRTPLLLSLALALSALALPAQALPDPRSGRPAELLRFVGDPASATGNAVSNGACDVNGDGDDDAVVGAWFWDKGTAGTNMGAAYVLLGGEHARGAALADPADAGAVRIDGPVADEKVGFSVACLGDVNGDGYDDIGIGDYLQNRAFVVFGAQKFTGLGLDALGDRGFIVKENFTNAADRSNLSYSMSAVGDINDDGLGDFALSAIVANTQGRANNGRVWIIAGRDDISDVNLSTPAAGEVLLSVDGAIAGERMGAVAKAGDVNGDGTDDFVLGSYTSTPWGDTSPAAGAAYVVFGGNTGSIDLLTLGSKGFKIFGPQRQRDRLGISVSSAGDVDHDGLGDLLIGADGVDSDANPRNGGAAIVLGSASTDTVYTDPAAANGQSVFTCPEGEPAATCATPTRRGYWINGATRGDSAGYSVAGLGDVNADDVPDFAIGAWGHDPVDPASAATMTNAGATYVVYGRSSGAVQQLSALSDASGYRINGLKAGDRFGRQVGAIGDFDGNGVNDLVAAGDLAARGTTAQNGELVVALMGQLVTATTVTGPASVVPTGEASFTATVNKPAGDPTPLSEGTVTFSIDGTAIDECSALPVVAGTVTCSAAFDEEVSGDLVASFSGSSRLQSSEARDGFTVAKTATVIGPDAVPAVTYGTQPAAIRGEIRGGDDLATGTVELREGSTLLGRSTVERGGYSVSIGATALTPGAHTLTLVYSGDTRNRGAERTIAVAVSKAEGRVSVTRSRSRLKGHQRLTVRIRVGASGVAPSGRVQIKIGAKTVKTLTLKGSKTRYTLPRFTSTGTKKVSVVYTGSDTVARDTTTVKVGQK